MHAKGCVCRDLRIVSSSYYNGFVRLLQSKSHISSFQCDRILWVFRHFTLYRKWRKTLHARKCFILPVPIQRFYFGLDTKTARNRKSACEMYLLLWSSLGFRSGVSNTRPTCGSRGRFVGLAMLFGHFQIINIYVMRFIHGCSEVLG